MTDGVIDNMVLQHARHVAFEKRIDIFGCALCSLNIDGICVPYQMAVEQGSKKPDHCRYIAVITGGDNL